MKWTACAWGYVPVIEFADIRLIEILEVMTAM